MSDILRFDLAKDPKGNPITYGRVGDSDGLTRRVKVFEDGKPLDLTGWTTTFEGNTSNWKTKVFDTEGISIIDPVKGEFSYTFPNKAFAVEGQYERAYFSFMKGDQRKSTGNFEIIVLGDSDIDAPEAETIITEYNKLVAELRKLQDEAISEMNDNFANTEAHIAELEAQISNTQTEIDQALEAFQNGNFWKKEESFNKEQSSANVIYQIIGKDAVEIQIQMDFEGKIASSNVENPHRRTLYSGPTLGTLGNFGEHSGQEAYDRTSKLDGIVDTRANNGNGNMRQERMDWNIVEGLTRVLGETFFSNQQAVTTVEKARLIRKITKKINPVVYGRGSSVGGNKLSHKRWLGSWEIGGTSTTSASVVNLGLPSENENTINSYIQDNGYGMSAVYAEPSDGVTLSTVIIDYACLEMTIKLSMNQYINSMIATYSGENVNKNFVGLGNVDNYATATQAEAEAGTATNKFVTPKGVAAYVDSINKVAEYKITDKSQIPDANAAPWVDELEAVFKRRGDRVDFFCRINFNKSTGVYTPAYLRLPQGFRLSTEFNNFIWNVPLAITKYVNADEFRGVAFAERQSSGGNYIRIGNKVTGNHWVSGTWYTDDPFPSVAGS